MGVRAVRWFAISAVGVALFLVTLALSAAPVTEARFKADDDTSFSALDFDDSQWRPARLDASWESQGIDPPGRIGWYRVRFHSPETGGDAPAVWIGMLGNVDEVFLNGERIGASGRFGRRFVQAPYLPRVYPLHPPTLREGPNVLAIRTQHTTYGGGITHGISLGSWNELASRLRDLKENRGYADMIMLVFLAVLLLIWLFSVLVGNRDRASIHLGVFLLLGSFASVVGSIWFQDAERKTPWIQTAELASYFLFATPLLSFALHFFDEPRRRRFGWLTGAGLAVALVTTFAVPLEHTDVFYAVAMPVLLLQVLASCVVALRAWRRGVSGSRVILIGFALAALSLALESMAQGSSLASSLPLGLFPAELGAAALLGCLLFAYVARAVRLNTRFAAVSAQVRGAQEAERERLARELHDGVAQSLLAIRFQMQSLGDQTEPAEFERLGEQLNGAVDELRGLSSSMRATARAAQDLPSLLEAHARSFDGKLHVRVKVDGELPASISLRAREHLYRIFQEAVGNAARHGSAKKVDVSLRAEDERCELRVEDDGRGFDVGETLAKSTGLGLLSMRQRADQLGGRCEIRSTKRGTTVLVSVPARVPA